MEGVLRDEGLRRWLVGEKEIDLNKLVFEVSNKTFMSGYIEEDPEVHASRITVRVGYFPIQDHQERLVAITLELQTIS